MKTLASLRLVASIVGSLLIGTACNGGGGGGGGGSSGSGSPNGTVAFAITDLPSEDVVSLEVDVTALRMRRANGTLVDALTAPVRVDLATLSDLSQILDESTLPKGAYTQLQVTLDFANATVMLAGQSTPAMIFDTDGNRLDGLVNVSIDFDTGPFIVIAAHQHVVELDFAIDQSVIVDTTANSVVIEPMFTVQVDQSNPKDLIAFGRLEGTDLAHDTFTVRLEALSGAPLSSATFEVEPTTVFQIDGVPLTGASGLSALSLKPATTWVQTFGQVVGNSSKIHALYVEAGAGTYDGGQDIVEGYVVDRSGGAGQDATLTVLGNSSTSDHSTLQFNTSFTVDTSFTNTLVVRSLSATQFDLDDVNVGQLVRVYGTLTNTTLNASLGGILRMHPTAVFGHASGAPVGSTLTIDLARVGFRDESAFNWSAVGSSPVDAAAFTIHIGSLGQGQSIGAGTAIVARGYFSAVDDDNEDFEALTLSNLETAPALILVRDRVGGFTVATTTDNNKIAFDISGTPALGEFAIVDKLFVGVVPLPTTPTPSVVAPTNGQGLYFLKDKHTGAAVFYKHFAAFANELGAKLNGGAMLTLFGAAGSYDSAANEMTAGLIQATVE